MEGKVMNDDPFDVGDDAGIALDGSDDQQEEGQDKALDVGDIAVKGQPMKPKESTRYFTALVRGKIVSTEEGKNIHVSTLRSTIQNCIIQDPTPDGSVVFDEDIDVLVK